MLQPAETDWVHRGNSSITSSFNRSLSCMLLPLSFLQQENRIWQHSDKPQAPLGIPLLGIDWSCYFTLYLLLIWTMILLHPPPLIPLAAPLPPLPPNHQYQCQRSEPLIQESWWLIGWSPIQSPCLQLSLSEVHINIGWGAIHWLFLIHFPGPWSRWHLQM